MRAAAPTGSGRAEEQVAERTTPQVGQPAPPQVSGPVVDQMTALAPCREIPVAVAAGVVPAVAGRQDRLGQPRPGQGGQPGRSPQRQAATVLARWREAAKAIGAAAAALQESRHAKGVGLLLSACAGGEGADRLRALGAAMRAWLAAAASLANDAASEAEEATRVVRMAYATDKLGVSLGCSAGRSLRDALWQWKLCHVGRASGELDGLRDCQVRVEIARARASGASRSRQRGALLGSHRGEERRR